MSSGVAPAVAHLDLIGHPSNHTFHKQKLALRLDNLKPAASSHRAHRLSSPGTFEAILTLVPRCCRLAPVRDMMQTYYQLAACAPSHQNNVYIFAVAPVASRALAAITSADELLLLNVDTLDASYVVRLQGVPHGLASLVVVDAGSTAICAGSDGTVATFDLRTHTRVAQFRSGKDFSHS